MARWGRFHFLAWNVNRSADHVTGPGKPKENSPAHANKKGKKAWRTRVNQPNEWVHISALSDSKMDHNLPSCLIQQISFSYGIHDKKNNIKIIQQTQILSSCSDGRCGYSNFMTKMYSSPFWGLQWGFLRGSPYSDHGGMEELICLKTDGKNVNLHPAWLLVEAQIHHTSWYSPALSMGYQVKLSQGLQCLGKAELDPIFFKVSSLSPQYFREKP